MSAQPVLILLIEDNPDDVFLIQRLLAKSLYNHFQVQCVTSLQVGLETLASTPVDAILLDLDLPDSKGINTLVQLQNEVPDIPIVVLTGFDDERQGIEAVHHGAQDYLIKGKTNGDVLVRALTYAIHRKYTEQELRKHRDHLEELVEARTAELVKMNEQLQCEVAERKQVEEAEREQRMLAEALRDTANALNNSLNLTEVLERILVNIEHVVPHDAAEIVLIEDGTAYVARSRTTLEPAGGEAESASHRTDVHIIPHLDYMTRTRQPLIISDLGDYPESIRSMLRGPEWRSYAGVPIYSQEVVIGFINLNSRMPHFFNPVHADRLQAFAEQAAIAIQNVRHREQQQALAAAQERERLARDLHDAVSQTLFSASVIAESLLRQWERNPEKAHERLSELHQLTRGALAEMRTLLLELRPTALLDVRLGDLLRQLSEAIQSRKRMTIVLNIGDTPDLPPNVKLTLYRIAQEAINNVAKHARASRAEIHLRQQNDQVEMMISDNGRGFDPNAINPNSMGLTIMHERADSIGASLSVTTELGAGTRIQVIWSTITSP